MRSNNKGSLAMAPVPVLRLLAILTAQQRLYRSLHWSAKGDPFYGDHLLFQRLYEDLDKTTDQVAERAVGLYGDEVAAATPVHRMALDRLDHWEQEIPTGLARALTSERELLSAVNTALPDASVGTQNLLEEVASRAEEHLYLLNRRKGGSRALRHVDIHEPAYVAESSPPVRKQRQHPATAELSRLELSKAGDDLLLAILLRGATGKRDPRQVAHDVLRETHGELIRILDRDYEIPSLSGEGRARLVASAELSRRAIHRSQIAQDQPLLSAHSVVKYLETMTLGPYETLSAIYLDRRRKPLAFRELSRGSDGFTIVDPRQIYRTAVSLGASAIILAHNHPSGDRTPSEQDRDVTRRVAHAGRVLGIVLLDHIVLGGGGRFTSLAEQGVLPSWSAETAGWTG